MIADDKKYLRLIKNNKIMISLVGIICVITTMSVIIHMKAIIIPLLLAMIIYFLLKPVFSFNDKDFFPEFISIIVFVIITAFFSYSVGHMINENIVSLSKNISVLKPLSILMNDYKT